MGFTLVLADDLSGAAETAAALGSHLRPQLALWPTLPDSPSDAPLVLDLDSRHLQATDAAARVRDALACVPTPEVLFKKIDSLLRGNVAAEIAPLLTPDAIVVLTPALPQQGRTVHRGVLLDRGVPLAETPLWALEPTPPPATIADALGRVPLRAIGLTDVRSPELTDVLATTAGVIAVCDAETQADLDALVASALTAGRTTGRAIRFVGSSDLARALGPHLSPAAATPAHPPLPTEPGSVLYVLGTGSEAALVQTDLLLAGSDAVHHGLTSQELVEAGRQPDAATAYGELLASELATHSVVLQVNASKGAAAGEDIVAGLAHLVSATLKAAPDWPVRLMLTGGQTARAVLDILGCGRLDLVSEIHPGAVLMTTGTGWLVATRPGSHGDRDSLLTIHHALTNPAPPNQEEA